MARASPDAHTAAAPPRRDGTVYGCGLTAHGQLPYLRSGAARGGGGADGAASSSGEDDPRRCEVTIPTRLSLPFLQQQARPQP